MQRLMHNKSTEGTGASPSLPEEDIGAGNPWTEDQPSLAPSTQYLGSKASLNPHTSQ